jgi:hypothetical protein
VSVDLAVVAPPFLGPNSPYAALGYLTGYLGRRGYLVRPLDLGIAVLNRLLTGDGVKRMAEHAGNESTFPWNDYADRIEPVMAFLRGEDPSAALRLTQPAWFPSLLAQDFTPPRAREAAKALARSGDGASLIATRFLRRLEGAISTEVDTRFRLDSFGADLTLQAATFHDLLKEILANPSPVTAEIEAVVVESIAADCPRVVAVTVPFRGCLSGAVLVAHQVRRSLPNVRIVLGGAFVSTELRALDDASAFEVFDQVVLDDGYEPLERILAAGPGSPATGLVRTFERASAGIRWHGGDDVHTHHRAVGEPDYDGLAGAPYFSLVDRGDPMERLWRHFRWTKLVAANGCYWARCSFCDVSLDYVRRFQRLSGAEVADHMVSLARRTGRRGFHFVDEALPPAFMIELADALRQKDRGIHWWGNVRLERAFTDQVVADLAEGGCIAVTAGLEVPSDRLLAGMRKGLTISSAIDTLRAFREHSVLSHLYLMFGFPDETLQETIDGLELVRQLFRQNLIASAHWQRFCLTRHSPLGAQSPAESMPESPLAIGDLERPADPAWLGQDWIATALATATDAFIRGDGTEVDVREWFERPVPPPHAWTDLGLGESSCG